MQQRRRVHRAVRRRHRLPRRLLLPGGRRRPRRVSVRGAPVDRRLRELGWRRRRAALARACCYRHRDVAEALLEIRDLITEFRTEHGVLRAVDGVSFEIPKRGTLGVVGESGCGKSVTALSVMRLIASPPGRIAGGEIRYGGKDLLALSEPEMRGIRGNRIAMIFQEPMTSLNPVFTAGDQVAE